MRRPIAGVGGIRTLAMPKTRGHFLGMVGVQNAIDADSDVDGAFMGSGYVGDAGGVSGPPRPFLSHLVVGRGPEGEGSQQDVRGACRWCRGNVFLVGLVVRVWSWLRWWCR